MSTVWKNRIVLACILLLLFLAAFYLFYVFYWDPKQTFEKLKRNPNYRPMLVVFSAMPTILLPDALMSGHIV